MAQSVIGALRVNLGLDSAQFERGVKKVESSTKRIGRQMQQVGAAVSVVGVGIAAAVRGQVRSIDELAKTSQQIGVPVDALSELRHAADLSGVSMSSLERGLRNTGRTMVSNADRFEELGVAVRNSDGTMRETMEVFNDTADELAKMEDGAEKTALAMQLFGERAGPEMIPLLNQGREGIAEMRREAEAMGLSVSQDTAESVQAFNDNMSRLSGTMRGLVQIITSELAPTLERISEGIARAAEVFQDLPGPVRRGGAAVAGLTVVLGPVLVALGALVAAVGAISAPVLAAIAVIAGLTAVAVAFWPQIKAAAEAVADFGRTVVEWIGDTVGDIVDWFKTVPKQLYETGVNMFRELFHGMREVASTVVSWVIEQGTKFLDWYIALPAKMLDVGINIFRELFHGMREVAPAVMDWLQETALQILQFFKDLPGQLIDIGRDMMNGLRDGIRDRVGSVRDAITGAASGAIDSARETLGIQSPSKVFHQIGVDTMKGFEGGVEDGGREVEGTMQRFANGLTGIFEAAMDGSRSVREEIGRLLQQLSRALMNRAFQSLLGGLFGGGGSSFSFDGWAGAGSVPVPSFAGGGFTGTGARSGGMDGRGGFPAILHPNETVIDHTKGGGGGNLNVTVTMDESTGRLGAFVRDEAVRVVSRAKPQIVIESVGAAVELNGEKRVFG